MPRKKRTDCVAKPRYNNNNNNNNNNNSIHSDENSMDDGILDGDLEDCPGHGQHPLQRNAANARERARMRVLSRAFCRLKTTLPWVPADTKLSKLDTLRLATSYIAHLRDVLLLPAGESACAQGCTPSSGGSPPNPLNLTWPFSFPQPGPEPWISRAPSSSRTTRVPATVPPTSSSNASSASAEDEAAAVVHEEDGVVGDFQGDRCPHPPMSPCHRLSGGRLLDLPDDHSAGFHGNHVYVPYGHGAYLPRFVDNCG